MPAGHAVHAALGPPGENVPVAQALHTPLIRPWPGRQPATHALAMALGTVLAAQAAHGVMPPALVWPAGHTAQVKLVLSPEPAGQLGTQMEALVHGSWPAGQLAHVALGPPGEYCLVVEHAVHAVEALPALPWVASPWPAGHPGTQAVLFALATVPALLMQATQLAEPPGDAEVALHCLQTKPALASRPQPGWQAGTQMVPLVQPVWLAGQLVQVALMPPREIWFVALQLTHTRLLLRPWPLGCAGRQGALAVKYRADARQDRTWRVPANTTRQFRYTMYSPAPLRQVLTWGSLPCRLCARCQAAYWLRSWCRQWPGWGRRGWPCCRCRRGTFWTFCPSQCRPRIL